MKTMKKNERAQCALQLDAQSTCTIHGFLLLLRSAAKQIRCFGKALLQVSSLVSSMENMEYSNSYISSKVT
jgi:hypothetical protein